MYPSPRWPDNSYRPIVETTDKSIPPVAMETSPCVGTALQSAWGISTSGHSHTDSCNFLSKWVCPQRPYYTAKFTLHTNTDTHSPTHTHTQLFAPVVEVPSAVFKPFFPIYTLIQSFGGVNKSFLCEAASCLTILLFMVWYLQLDHKTFQDIKLCPQVRFSTTAQFYGPIILII